MPAFELTNIRFQAGPAPGSFPLDVSAGTVTLLVGPNNSGKSRALGDIAQWATGGDLPGIVLDRVRVEWPETFEDAAKALGSYVQPDLRPNIFRVASPTVPGGSGGQEETPIDQIRHSFHPSVAEDADYQRLRRRFTLRFLTALWTGRERFALASDQLTDLNAPPQLHLQVLFRDDSLRAELRGMIHEAFGMYFVLDPTQPGQVRMRLSPKQPPSPAVERGLDERAIAFHSQSVPLNELSDGIQCYVGMLAALMSLDLKIVLLDEPEAFLHPPLARRLGDAIAEIAKRRGARVVAATHSADFLRGCVESSASTTIVRLTYDRGSGASTARSLTTPELRPLLTDPLLRSTRALEGLFHRAVIVGESDADRAFYDECNRRLLAKGRGVADAQFVNAQNWSTESRVIGPLRRLGVPAAGIVDFDTLWNPVNEWRTLYRAIGLPDAHPERQRLERARVAVTDPNDRARGKASGVAGLPTVKRAPMRALLADLADYGVFVVPVGELEKWLPDLLITGVPKPKWIVQMLTRLGTDPSRSDYVQPGRGGVWRFLDSVERWVADPGRKGMPS